MEVLLETIGRIRQNIKMFREKLRRSEALTRYVLIDPLLRALGWDTTDPTQVIPEFPIEQGRPDYALLREGTPLIVIEAKSLGSDLKGARDKGFKYCWHNKIPYYVITDGDVWELYDLRIIGGKLIFQTKLSEDNPGDVARQHFALWRPAMPEVKPVPTLVISQPVKVKESGAKPSIDVYERPYLREKSRTGQPRSSREQYEELFKNLKARGASIEQVARTEFLINKVPVLVRFSRPLKGGNFFFFGLNPKALQRVEWILFVCGEASKTLVIHRDWLYDRLKDVRTAQDGDWKFGFYKIDDRYEMKLTGKLPEDVTYFLNNFDKILKYWT